MKIDKLYIISYLPDDIEIRQARLDAHKKQIEYWSKHPIEIVVFAQNYNENDYLENVTYIKNESDKILRPGSARNECLKDFYKSDLDFTLIIDDDTVLYEGEKYMDSDNIISILQNIPIDDFKDIDIFSMLNPTQSPFTKYYNDNRSKGDKLQDNLVFTSKINIRADIFIRNTKKFYNKELYFEDLLNDDGTIIMGEDVKFSIDAAINEGMKIYECKNIVRKDLAWTKSTWCESNEKRLEAFDVFRGLMKEWGVPFKNGRFKWKDLARALGIPDKVLVKKALLT